MAEFKTTATMSLGGTITQVAIPTGIIASDAGARAWDVKAIEITPTVSNDAIRAATAAGPMGFVLALSSVALGNGVLPSRASPQTIMRIDRGVASTAAATPSFSLEWPVIYVPQEDQLLVAAENLYAYGIIENMGGEAIAITFHWDAVELSALEIYQIRFA